ncbi:unnamed protein product [Dracunculus medinensis]|uniref:CCR4-NOT transcription complex subunit 9 n=1 Tax=Dracunculus medinensis TaxID=318479 RepID=A0A0N4U7T5_DRAME|nr:unnamed protein product [Dracunculus medinensis]
MLAKRTRLHSMEELNYSLRCHRPGRLAAAMASSEIREMAQSTEEQQYTDVNQVHQWILDLIDPIKRENALLELRKILNLAIIASDICSKRRNVVPDLAVWLWYTSGSMAALILELITIYPTITTPTLTVRQSNRACNALALMQCVASHRETAIHFLAAHIPLFLFPFLHTTSESRPYEFLRLTSLGEVIQFLLTTDIISLCLQIMNTGTELSKTVATFILQKVLLNDDGLAYVCRKYECFLQVIMVLKKMVIQLAQQQSLRLLKHIIRCYNRLSENPRLILNPFPNSSNFEIFDQIIISLFSATQILRQYIPDQLRDGTFNQILQEDKLTRHWLTQLLKNIGKFHWNILIIQTF